MILAVLGAAVAAAVGLFVLLLVEQRNLRHALREHSRERAMLLDRLAHATGNTWTPPPAETQTYPEPNGVGAWQYETNPAMADFFDEVPGTVTE